MYIIEEGKAYLVDGKVGYLANFSTTGKMLVNEKETIDATGKKMYSYEEIYAKLNIAYMIEETKRKSAMNDVKNEAIEEINELTNKIAELETEKVELTNKIAELETENEELKQQLTAKIETENEVKAPIIENFEENQSPEVENAETGKKIVEEETEVGTNTKRKK